MKNEETKCTSCLKYKPTTEFNSKPDVCDRCVVVEDEVLSHKSRLTKDEKFAIWHAVHPEIDRVLCPSCQTEKEPEEFWMNVGCVNGLQTYCIECHRERTKELYDRDPEKMKSLVREWERSHPLKTAAYAKQASQLRKERMISDPSYRQKINDYEAKRKAKRRAQRKCQKHQAEPTITSDSD